MAIKTYTVTSSTWTDYDNQTTNYGSNPTLKVGIIWSGTRQYFGYIQSPPLSFYDGTGTINSMKLYLYGTQTLGSTDYGVSWARVNETAWDEDSITWNSDPEGEYGDRTDTVGDFPTSGSDWVYCDIGVTKTEAWRDETYLNTGVFLSRNLGAGGSNNIANIDSDDGTNQPYWELDYTPSASSQFFFFKTI